MSVRTPTPDLIDAMRHENERHEVQSRHVRRAIPGWGWALLWIVTIGAVVAIILALS